VATGMTGGTRGVSGRPAAAMARRGSGRDFVL